MALVDARLRIGSKMLLALSYGGTRKANGFTHTALDSFVNVVSQIGSHHLSSLSSVDYTDAPKTKQEGVITRALCTRISV